MCCKELGAANGHIGSLDDALVLLENQDDVVSYNLMMRDLMEVAQDRSYEEFTLFTQNFLFDLRAKILKPFPDYLCDCNGVCQCVGLKF